MRATSSSRADTPGRVLDSTGHAAMTSASVVTPLTLTDQLPSVVRMVPADVSRHSDRRLSATSAALRPRAARAWASGMTLSSGVRRPLAETRSTPLIRSISSLMRRALRRRFSSSACPCNKIEAVGKPLEVVISMTRGSLAASGSSLAALFWTSRRRSVMRLSNAASDSSRKRTNKLDTAGRELDCTNRMSATPRTASSSGLVTRRSTSSAVAPGRSVVMLTQLKLISGSCSRGIEL